MSLAEIGLIGNCQLAAHVRSDGAIVWACMPRFDSAPIFGELLDPDGGSFLIGAADGSRGVQTYLPNTNVLETTFATRDGSFRVLDFAPRFLQHGRTFRPAKLVRIVEPLSGTPRVVVRVSPILGYEKARPRRETGSHHVSFLGYEEELRLTTDAPLAYLDGDAFALPSPVRFVLSYGSPVEEELEPLCDRFLNSTVRYWRNWVRHCHIPTVYQNEVIRSALALKLHCYEDTGAIVAALTTSLPEAPGAGRNWDYRYCWLRDAYYAIDAFRMLGHFEEREQFLHYLLNIASSSVDGELAPLYRIDGKSDLEEILLPAWRGFSGESPVRVGNGAAVHKQYDVYGEVVLALTPLFVDARFADQVSPSVLETLTRIARKAAELAGKPDAGIWELRTEWRPQTFTSLMCWAACDRMAKIARIHRPTLEAEFVQAAERIRSEILAKAVDAESGTLVMEYGGKEVDAALLQAVTLGLLPPNHPTLARTVDAIVGDLDFGGWLKRYKVDDGFGEPEVAFTFCTFWLVQALAKMGRGVEAVERLERVRGIRSPLGLLSEDVDPTTGTMWGNFPQAYSHVGMIHAAFAIERFLEP